MKIFVNANEYQYAPDDWQATQDGLLFEGTLAPSTVGLVPSRTTLAGATVPLNVTGGVHLVPEISPARE